MSDVHDLLDPKRCGFKPGDIVKFEQGGRYPKSITGKVLELDSNGILKIQDRWGTEYEHLWAFCTIVKRGKNHDAK